MQARVSVFILLRRIALTFCSYHANQLILIEQLND